MAKGLTAAQMADRDRANWHGADAVKWLRSAKRLTTAQRNGGRVADVTIRSSQNEAVLAARAADGSRIGSSTDW